ncbi:hypothetical protein [Motiliproteus sp. SC1-56]|uniref:hypothetical protein n=1 Tax=Motiliproteus sp. SC1-56 TaxID=2799565 RepID=UPI001A8F4BE8|nr:hypothetical protein [Motiliproteus sp. SC1-56]
MSAYLEKLKDFKGNTKAQCEQFILENSKKSLANQLKEAGVDINDVQPEEMEELLAAEVEKQKEYAKGLAVGAGGIAVLLELM